VRNPFNEQVADDGAIDIADFDRSNEAPWGR
jgi:hypothetical protein